jgi:hypothetical protein
MKTMPSSQLSAVFALLPLVLFLCAPASGLAHGISGDDASFVEANQGAALPAFAYLGAKHMVTGYDHILFLIGVIFFLYRIKHVIQYVSLFTIGHSLALLVGVLGGIHANPFIVDAIIGLSVVYKAFDNMGGFQKLIGFQPNTKAAVGIFGLFHGFGLATKLQEFSLSNEGLLWNILSFNVGVELGQVLALSFVLLALAYWRTHRSFSRHAIATNAILMTGGFLLVIYQVAGYFVS